MMKFANLARFSARCLGCYGTEAPFAQKPLQ
jgi:hypothetical protein